MTGPASVDPGTFASVAEFCSFYLGDHRNAVADASMWQRACAIRPRREGFGQGVDR
jgi:hypothetical protein